MKMTEKKLQMPLTAAMPAFGVGFVNQSMIDALNRNPVLVERLNSYNNDVVNGYRTDPTTGGNG
jgi:hypothetical protein